jgi:hypothetical protein
MLPYVVQFISRSVFVLLNRYFQSFCGKVVLITALGVSPWTVALAKTKPEVPQSAAERFKKQCREVEARESNDPKEIKKAAKCLQQAIGSIVLLNVADAQIDALVPLNKASTVGGTRNADQWTHSSGPQASDQDSSQDEGGQGSVVIEGTQSAYRSPSACDSGSGHVSSNLRVTRSKMYDFEVKDDFGYRIGTHYLVYQVMVSNLDSDHFYLLHDVSLDFGRAFGLKRGAFEYRASTRDLSLMRGVPEQGADLDPRNLTLHLLQGIGSVAGAISGLTAFSDVMGSSVAAFNGPFIQGFTGTLPDHTANQEGVEPDLNAVDVCVDGAFVTEIDTQIPVITGITLDNPSALADPALPLTATIKGSHLSNGQNLTVNIDNNKITPVVTNSSDTQIVVGLTRTDTFPSSVSLTMTVTKGSNSASYPISNTNYNQSAPTVTAATYLKSTSPAVGTPLTLSIVGSNLVTGDTVVQFCGTDVGKLSSPDGRNATSFTAIPPAACTAMLPAIPVSVHSSAALAPVSSPPTPAQPSTP